MKTIATIIFDEEHGLLIKTLSDENQVAATTLIHNLEQSVLYKTKFRGVITIKKIIKAIESIDS